MGPAIPENFTEIGSVYISDPMLERATVWRQLRQSDMLHV